MPHLTTLSLLSFFLPLALTAPLPSETSSSSTTGTTQIITTTTDRTTLIVTPRPNPTVNKKPTPLFAIIVPLVCLILSFFALIFYISFRRKTRDEIDSTRASGFSGMAPPSDHPGGKDRSRSGSRTDTLGTEPSETEDRAPSAQGNTFLSVKELESGIANMKNASGESFADLKAEMERKVREQKKLDKIKKKEREAAREARRKASAASST